MPGVLKSQKSLEKRYFEVQKSATSKSASEEDPFLFLAFLASHIFRTLIFEARLFWEELCFFYSSVRVKSAPLLACLLPSAVGF
jgi:hypothetical protein